MSGLREAFRDHLARKQQRNKRYSARALARDLNVSQTSLSMFLKGERKPSQKMARRLLDAITNLPLEDRDVLRAEVESSFKNIDLDAADSRALASSWHYFAILSLAEIEGFQENPSWIADRLNIGCEEAHHALATLVRLQMLIHKDGRLRPSGYRYSVGAHAVIREAHVRTLELGTKKLGNLNDPDLFANSDFSSIIIATDRAVIPEIKDRIKRFRRSISRVAERGRPTDVVVFAMQLFPVTEAKPVSGSA